MRLFLNVSYSIIKLKSIFNREKFQFYVLRGKCVKKMMEKTSVRPLWSLQQQSVFYSTVTKCILSTVQGK